MKLTSIQLAHYVIKSLEYGNYLTENSIEILKENKLIQIFLEKDEEQLVHWLNHSQLKHELEKYLTAAFNQMDYDPNPAQAAIINAILKKHVNNLIKKQTVDEFFVKKVDPVEK
ncbi:hypothetical protein [Legionella micdadei]|uniref:Uncharacterized protein n=1 Tax=Legionella micdadei TaxID=451 RepID=A0A098GF84_LEGMI|nr:hypothetical protein [Legionella micdadei]ARG97761.1 hypothetical protein B6N58_08845 [Legionella micdadei]ARG99926.1 hypothetical protein B6V88_05575 [Legionella micdadei]KTD28465.1 hypothetical protein Lmic_1576 [Legionella micdadei]NSL18763.1 hypothetical protein [Legionella micdadei]CEG60645.1 protein of unknown function [Legionella micdadei]